MNKVNVVVIGHLPPPVTGENLCRRELVEAVRRNNFQVKDLRRSSAARLVLAKGHGLLIYNGKSSVGSFIDILVTFVGLIRFRRVYWCFHNIAWRRFSRIPRWVWLGQADRITPVALRQVIADTFKPHGFRAVVLNNCPERVFEENPVVTPVTALRRIIWMGRLEAVKGFDTTLSAFEKLRAIDASWRLDVYGGTVEQAKAAGFYSPNADYHGFISGAAKVSAFAKGGIFILPSRYLHETQPLSIIEAFSQGIPVVASTRGGIREMLESSHGPAGIVLDEGSADDYARALEMVFSDYQSYSRRSLATYGSLFSRGRYEREVMALLQAIE